MYLDPVDIEVGVAMLAIAVILFGLGWGLTKLCGIKHKKAHWVGIGTAIVLYLPAMILFEFIWNFEDVIEDPLWWLILVAALVWIGSYLIGYFGGDLKNKIGRP